MGIQGTSAVNFGNLPKVEIKGIANKVQNTLGVKNGKELLAAGADATSAAAIAGIAICKSRESAQQLAATIDNVRGKTSGIVENLLDITNDKKYYYGNGALLELTQPNGRTYNYFNNGKIRRVELPNGKTISWFENGKPSEYKSPTGLQKKWHDNGRIKELVATTGEDLTVYGYPDLTSVSFYRNGAKSKEVYINGDVIHYHQNGNKTCVETKAGQIVDTFYVKDGKPDEKFISGKKYIGYYPNGNLKYDYSGETRIEYFEDGKVSFQENPDGSIEKFYESGALKHRKNPDGSIEKFYESGALRGRNNPDGFRERFYESGAVAGIRKPDGSIELFSESGNLIKTKDINGNITQ